MTTTQAIRREIAHAFVQQPLRSTGLALLILGGLAYAAKSHYDNYTSNPVYNSQTCLKSVNTAIGKKLPKYIQSGTVLEPQKMFNECLQKGPRE